MAGRRMGKQAYRMTARRKAALKRAQLISARKRRKNRAINGVLAGGALAAVAAYGYRQGAFKGIAADLKGRDFRFTNTRSQVAKFVQPPVKEANVVANAVSPASVKPQAAPVNSPSMGSTSTPKPGKVGVPKGLTPVNANVTHVASEGAVLDSANLNKAKNPYPHLPPDAETRILAKLGKTRSQIGPNDRTDLRILAEMWVDHDIANGRRMKFGKVKQRIWAYTSILDIFGLETLTAEKERKKAGK